MLHARPYRDSSVIAEFFTRDHGRLALVAQGARRPKSKLKGQLRPFQRCLISWVTRGSLGTLTALETEHSVAGRIPRQVLSAYYVNELIMRALRPGDSQADIFSRYERILDELESEDEAMVLRLFERDLLEYLGYGLMLNQTRSGQAVAADAHYRFDVMEGPEAVAAGPATVPGSSLLALFSGAFDSQKSLADAKRILRWALDLHLGVADSKVRQVLVAMQAHRKEWHQKPDGDAAEADL
jgi:DNA repair protein RecO (recombination protein O)